MITEIILKNFKCYKEQKFILNNLSVFCGNNSVGKSTAIQALAVPFQSRFQTEVALNNNLVELGSIRDIFSAYANKNENYLKITLKFNDQECSWGEESSDETSDLIKNYLHNQSMTVNKEDLYQNYFSDKGFQFLQAERFGPRVYLENSHDQTISNWLGPKGEYTYQVLTQLDNVGARLDLKDKRILDNNEGPSIRRNIVKWMSEISPGFNFESHIVTNAGISHAQFQAYGSEKTKPINMGFGLSYSLSIVCALLLTKPGGLVIIENPEAHLHPKGQSYLGRLIAKSALAGVQVIIETHSDHLLNGIRVAARLDDDYLGEDFSVFFVSGNNKAASNVEKINIGSKGELSSWPDGFFDQQAYDVKTLMTGKEVSDLGLNQ
ncbi:DUF3696 domain-containing protein [Thiomicrospira sp. S5]|uniref:DUF3696 domain-containing protein n=1 Tax=Thiomicrospira sp. S5 TaxID=1803865 RepID=UPI000F89FE00|nr:DUF3696 domain-containing protein [Thiomicrospira sp. S5]AZR82962.1 nucleoside triphosphate hydrolase [Thiomicrospira sp. S5]